jgi:hypothetical protein
MSILIQALSTPQILSSLKQEQWQILLAQANVSQLVGRLNYLMDKHQYPKPSYVKWHLESSYKIAEKQRKQALVEFLEVPKALKALSTQLIFLKGAAYIAKQLPCSYGRTFSDIDVLVKKDQLKKIENILKFSNWLKSEVDDYDEKYYRTWMHEIPPLCHVTRGSVLDVHHNILPSTNKHTPKVESFSFTQVEVENVGKIYTLDDTDICIHMAVHLFTESEFHNGLRDISDFDILLRHFQKSQPDFVIELIKRAKLIGLYDYTRLAIRYCHIIFSTPIGNIKLNDLKDKSNLLTRFQDFCFINIFKPNHKTCRTWKMAVAEFCLYWRGHLIRMPLRLLIPHLFRKTIKRVQDYFKQDDSLDNNLP